MSDELKITAPRNATGWMSGTFGSLEFDAKVYDNPSHFGINAGRVSKLLVKDAFNVIYEYDRGGQTPTELINSLVAAIEAAIVAPPEEP